MKIPRWKSYEVIFILHSESWSVNELLDYRCLCKTTVVQYNGKFIVAMPESSPEVSIVKFSKLTQEKNKNIPEDFKCQMIILVCQFKFLRKIVLFKITVVT